MSDADLSDEELRSLVALGCNVLAFVGQADMVWGHISCRDPRGRGIWMKGHDLGFDEVTADDVLLVSLDGEILEGKRRRHAEYPIHTEVIRARADVGCVVHTHAEVATAFAAKGEPLRPISHDGTLFVPPDIVRFTKTGDLIRTGAGGAELAATLGDRNALLIPNHGMVATGPTVSEGVMTAVLLAKACSTQLLAGQVKVWSSDEEALSKRGNCWGPGQLDLGWDYLVRRLKATQGAA